MSSFLQRLNELSTPGGRVAGHPGGLERRWLFVPYDQLSSAFGPLAVEPPDEIGIVLVETLWKPRRRPYHRQKLALLLSSQRHFALEQASRGVAVRYVFGEASYSELLRPVAQELGGLEMQQAAERELRVDLEPLIDEGLLEVLPHEGWLTTSEQFLRHAGVQAPWRMDAFYRGVRRETGILMQSGKPVGGRFSFDGENRKAWRGDPPAPEPPRFEVDEITVEVGELVETLFVAHPGALDLAAIPASQEDVEVAWKWALDECLESFGPYEDAMSTRSTGLFHTRISALMNLHRLAPQRIVEDVLASELPLASKEGFVRQVIGWREFMRHVHEQTDGFRQLEPQSGVGGLHEASFDGGATPSALGSDRSLPAVFWAEDALGESRSGLHCLDRVIEEVWREGYSHHIARLMILGNLATLLDTSPRELTDWFWVAYTDAYDWVVEPNVLGMATFGVGGLFTTKPYVSGANYIDKMSDYCSECSFHPKKTCPVTRWYWAFLARHREQLEGNQRVAMPLRSLAKRSEERRREDELVFLAGRALLDRAERLTPASLAAEQKRVEAS